METWSDIHVCPQFQERKIICSPVFADQTTKSTHVSQVKGNQTNDSVN